MVGCDESENGAGHVDGVDRDGEGLEGMRGEAQRSHSRVESGGFDRNSVNAVYEKQLDVGDKQEVEGIQNVKDCKQWKSAVVDEYGECAVDGGRIG